MYVYQVRMSGEISKFCFFGSVVDATIYSGVYAAGGAADGFTGASVLKAAGHAGFDPLTAANMGAIGGAIYGAAFGLFAPCRFFANQNSEKKTDNSLSLVNVAFAVANIVAGVAIAVLFGLTGYGVVSSLGQETGMNLANTAASFAVGEAVSVICVTIALNCVNLLIMAACTESSDEHSIESSDEHGITTPLNSA